MREWLARFMAGRYGSDQFSRFLAIATLLLIAINMFVGGVAGRILSIVIYVLLFYSIFRTLSRNYPRRQAENRAYMRLETKVRGLLNRNQGQRRQRQQARRQQRQNYVFFTCPACQAQLRVPRGRGNIEITCARCGHKFIGKS